MATVAGESWENMILLPYVTPPEKIEAAIKSQTVSLETKLGLIEQSVSQGLADNQKSLKLIQEALEALNGTLARKLASLESAIRSETTGLESKLDLIKTAVGTGLADASQQEDLILQAVEALNGTLDDKLKAISTAIANQQRDLDIKLGLIQAAIEKGLTNHAQAQALIQEAIVAINGNASAKLEAITATVSKQTTSLWAKLELIGTAFNTGLADAATALGQIYQALKSINDESVASIVSRFALLESIMDDRLPKTLENIFAAVESMPDYRHILGAINWALYKCTEHSIGGYEYVEMAPGLKWATMNVGSTSPEEIGIYYAWGELNIKNKDAYTWNNYKFWAWDSEHSDKPEQFFITKYTFEDKVYDARWYGWGESGFTGDDITWLGKPVAGYDFADDVARQDWGSSWRMPTEKEWAALCDTLQYEWTWIDDYNGSGTAGVQITSWAAGCEGYQIFLPAAGRKDGTVNETDWNGYWSSMLAGVSFEADACFFNASEHHMSSEIENSAAIPLPKRYLGLQVRPVSE